MWTIGGGYLTPHPNPLLKEERETVGKFSPQFPLPFQGKRTHSISSPFSRERIKVRVY
jgi:hypothetical protein